MSADLDIASWISTNPTLDSLTTILDRVFGILVLVLDFQVRGGFNGLLRVLKSDPYSFGGVYTWLFGVIYLQYKLNQNIRRWRSTATEIP